MATKIVLTGGPCGGKTTALSKLSDRLEAFGYRTLCVPEAATLLLKGGLSFEGADEARILQLQETMMQTILSLEASFDSLATTYGHDKTVILCDRGAIDIKAFCGSQIWQTLLDQVGMAEGPLKDRYDAVIHMVTAAIGAEEFYTLENNSARTETPEQAAAVDRAIQDAWVGHPHLRIVDNTTDFDEKVRKVVAHICQTVGIPEPIEKERRFLIYQFDKFPEGLHRVEVPITQDYLVSQDGSESRVRMRELHGSRLYTQTTKTRLGGGAAIEKERRITPREYMSLLSTRDPERSTVRKDRQCFVWEGQYIELDSYRDLPYQILEIEVEDLHEEVVLPPFVEVEREITGDPRFSNYALAREVLKKS